jgi:hypothetical protein
MLIELPEIASSSSPLVYRKVTYLVHWAAAHSDTERHIRGCHNSLKDSVKVFPGNGGAKQ